MKISSQGVFMISRNVLHIMHIDSETLSFCIVILILLAKYGVKKLIQWTRKVQQRYLGVLAPPTQCCWADEVTMWRWFHYYRFHCNSLAGDNSLYQAFEAGHWLQSDWLTSDTTICSNCQITVEVPARDTRKWYRSILRLQRYFCMYGVPLLALEPFAIFLDTNLLASMLFDSTGNRNRDS